MNESSTAKRIIMAGLFRQSTATMAHQEVESVCHALELGWRSEQSQPTAKVGAFLHCVQSVINNERADALLPNEEKNDLGCCQRHHQRGLTQLLSAMRGGAGFLWRNRANRRRKLV
jgi:hypothetical protein